MSGQEERHELRETAQWGPGHSIPAPLTALIGREPELRDIGDVLRRARLVTLTGPGGVGKTRTAIELGRRRARKHADGVAFVDLASVAGTGREDVAAVTARALEIRGLVGNPATDVVRRRLADSDMLLLLDNCEHVLDACAELGATLLGACSGLRILATSREPLGIPGEVVWRLAPLSPEHASRLFLARARERSQLLIADHETQAAVLEICTRVDHLPLGIELAAARVGIMSPHEISTSLETLGEVSRPRRSTPARHRSVRAAVEWSYNLLDPGEQAAFRSLAVFVGGFDADAARAVAPMSLEMLAGLVDKSLITVVAAQHGPTRYRLLETMRKYASEQLALANEKTAAQMRHLRHFSTLGIAAEEGWMSARVLEWLEKRSADYGNIRAAVEWAAASAPCTAMGLLAETKDLFFLLGQADGRRLAELVLQRCPERSRNRAEVTIAAGHYAFLMGDVPAAADLMTDAAELSVALGERSVEGTARWFLGLHQLFGGAPDKGRGHLTAAREIQQETGDLLGEARTTAALGLTYLMEQEHGRARELLEAALAIGLEAHDRWSQGQANLYLGILAESSGDRQAAASSFREAVECLKPYRDSTLLPVALVGQAGVVARGDPQTGLRILAAASAERARNGGEFAPFFRAFAERIRAAAVAGAAQDPDRLWNEGSRLTIDEAIALAFGTTRPPTPHALGISPRELDVVRLVAVGLPNKEIAGRLHLSVRTVESHVRHVLTKTGLLNRTQLATWARERDE